MASYEEVAQRAEAYIKQWFSRYEQSIRSVKETFNETDIRYIELKFNTQDRVQCVQDMINNVEGYSSLSSKDRGQLGFAARYKLNALFADMKNSLPRSDASPTPEPEPSPEPTPTPEPNPEPSPEQASEEDAKRLADAKLSSALEAVNEAVKEDVETAASNKKNAGEDVTESFLSDIIDKAIVAHVNFYAPLSASDEDKEWLIKEAKKQEASLIQDIVDTISESRPESGSGSESQSGEGSGGSTFSSSSSGVRPSSTSGASSRASSSKTGTSTIFDSMFGDLGKRNAFTVHNINGRRYYSTIDATIFLNNKEIEEVIQLQWTVEENVMPLFGYNSYIWDEVARGSRIISGAFAINFTIPDYLEQLVNNVSDDSNITFKNTGKKIEKNDHAPRWAKGFTIGVGYGSKDSVIGEQPCTFLENVQLKSSGQALDTQGGQLVEIYQFIARDWKIQR